MIAFKTEGKWRLGIVKEENNKEYLIEKYPLTLLKTKVFYSKESIEKIIELNE